MIFFITSIKSLIDDLTVRIIIQNYDDFKYCDYSQIKQQSQTTILTFVFDAENNHNFEIFNIVKISANCDFQQNTIQTEKY